MRLKIYHSAILGTLLLASCFPLFFWHLNVFWEINGSSARSLCTQYDIKEWRVAARGMETRQHTFSCGDWDSSNRFHDLEEGYYDVTVSAWDAQGARLAQRTKSLWVEETVWGNPSQVHFNFAGADFSGSIPPGYARLNVYWNINGTEDGTATGFSWDKCAEVGAAYAAITVDGVTKYYDCHANNNMSVALTIKEGSGTQAVGVKLADKNKIDLTTESTGPAYATHAKAGIYLTDFYYFSFLPGIKSSIQGSYKFSTSFEQGQSCTGTAPQVVHTTMSLYKTKHFSGSGDAVVTEFCGPDSVCRKTNGADYAKCYAKDQTQRIKSMVWGLYQMTLQGGVGSGAAFQVCWEKKTHKDMKDNPFLKGVTDILVGAGDTNPLRKIDLPRTSNRAACK